jgi:hypothetical protein
MIKDAKKDCGYDITDDCRFFCGEPHETDYKKSSPGGIQGVRYMNLPEVIGNSTDAKDVATKLVGKQ